MKRKISLKEYIKNMKMEFGDLKLQLFHFNPFMVNTMLFYDETKEAVIIDPGNYSPKEDAILEEYVENHNLKVKMILNTHPHIDHVLGNDFCKKTFSAPLAMHSLAVDSYQMVVDQSDMFGFSRKDFPTPDLFLTEDKKVEFGSQSWSVLYVPGHAEGSVAFYDKEHKFAVVGDLIFNGSIGRTDLPTGDFALLIDSVKTKIFTLENDVVLIPGHDVVTSVEKERKFNPFF